MSASVSRADRAVVGSILGIIAFALLSVADAMIKLLSSRYSIFEIASVDAGFAILVAGAYLVRRDGLASLRPKRAGLVLARSIIGGGSVLAVFFGFATVPLAEAYAISFVAPLLVTALAYPFLGEHVSLRQWGAVIVGFVAVIVILRPGIGAVGIGQICVLASAIFFAISMMMVRRLSGQESDGAILIVYLTTTLILGLPLAIMNWKMPDLGDLALMLVAGLATAFGNLVLINAFRAAQAALVSSFIYTQLIWGTAFGLVLFGDGIDAITIIGAAVIIACGIYTLRVASARAKLAPAASE